MTTEELRVAVRSLAPAWSGLRVRRLLRVIGPAWIVMLVTRRKDGRLTFYRLAEPSLRRFLRAFDDRLRSTAINFGASPWSVLCPDLRGSASGA